jgi:cytochrome c553
MGRADRTAAGNGCSVHATGCTRVTADTGHALPRTFTCKLYFAARSVCRNASAAREKNNPASDNFQMMRPLTIAASLWLAPMLLAAAQTPAAPQTTSAAPAAASTAANLTAAAPAAASTAAAPAAATPAALQGDAAKGRLLTYTCQGCHGVTGYKNAYPNYHVPRIGGQTPQYLSNALHEYRQGKRKHPTMQAQAESFSEQDIADIAAYLSSVK